MGFVLRNVLPRVGSEMDCMSCIFSFFISSTMRGRSRGFVMDSFVSSGEPSVRISFLIIPVLLGVALSPSVIM